MRSHAPRRHHPAHATHVAHDANDARHPITPSVTAVLFSGHTKDCVGMAPQSATNKSAPKLASMIREEQPQIIHMFSNGGSLCWANALGYERRKGGGNGSPGTTSLLVFPSVTHVIADSCPGLAHLSDYPQIVNFLFAVTRNGLMPGRGTYMYAPMWVRRTRRSKGRGRPHPRMDLRAPSMTLN